MNGGLGIRTTLINRFSTLDLKAVFRLMWIINDLELFKPNPLLAWVMEGNVRISSLLLLSRTSTGLDFAFLEPYLFKRQGCQDVLLKVTLELRFQSNLITLSRDCSKIRGTKAEKAIRISYSPTLKACKGYF